MAGAQLLQQLASWEQDATDAAAIGSAIVRVWQEAGRSQFAADGAHAPATGLLRARVANVIACVASEQAAERAKAILGSVIMRQPVRSLLCIARPDAGRDSLSASARVYCNPIFGRNVCFERLSVTAEGRETEQLASVATQLLTHDLPTLLWYLDEPRWEGPQLAGLEELADVLVVDSADFAQQANGLVALAGAAGVRSRQTAVSDLNWNRLSDWREVIAQFFDSRATRSLLGEIRSVTMEIATPAGSALDSAQALLLAGWLASRLGWETGMPMASDHGLFLEMRHGVDPIEIRILPKATATRLDRSLRAVQIEAGPEAGRSRFSLVAGDAIDAVTATIELGGAPAIQRCFAFEERDEAALLAEEIEALGRERALDEALAVAGRLAAILPPSPSSSAAETQR